MRSFSTYEKAYEYAVKRAQQIYDFLWIIEPQEGQFWVGSDKKTSFCFPHVTTGVMVGYIA